MAFQRIKHIRIAGIAACVPKRIEENIDLPIFSNSSDAKRFIDNTGVERRRVVDETTCSSDLCFKAAQELVSGLNWDKNEIDCLIFVSQTPDYIYPATACILQSRLGLNNECMAFDISLGCSGWVYGLSVISALISASAFKKGLLLVGETSSKSKSPLDKSTYPLFGDAGTATAINFDENAPDLLFDMNTDGSNHNAIMIRDGGYRYPFSSDSLVMKENGDGNSRNNTHSVLDGATVFTFGISKAPRSINSLIDHFEIERESIDFFVLHQANKMMTEKIRKKIGASERQTPYIIGDFGNTSSTSIPLNLVVSLEERFRQTSRLKILACAFGVGLSWASVYVEFERTYCCKLIEY